MTQGTDAFVQILKSHKLKGPSCSIKTNEVVSKQTSHSNFKCCCIIVLRPQ